MDDDLHFPRLMELILRRAGFKHIVHFSDALPGLNYLTGGRDLLPHVALLDVQMPRLAGFEILKRIRQRWDKREMAVFLITSSYHSHDEHRAEAEGATGYLDKMHAFWKTVKCLDELIAEHNRSQQAVARSSELSPTL